MFLRIWNRERHLWPQGTSKPKSLQTPVPPASLSNMNSITCSIVKCIEYCIQIAVYNICFKLMFQTWSILEHVLGTLLHTSVPYKLGVAYVVVPLRLNFDRSPHSYRLHSVRHLSRAYVGQVNKVCGLPDHAAVDLPPPLLLKVQTKAGHS